MTDQQATRRRVARQQETGRHATGRRLALATAGAVTVALGLGIRAFVDAAWAGPAGDMLYAALVSLVIAFLLLRRPRWQVGVAALVVCWAIELFQATGVPADLAATWPPIRLLLGTTFVPVDLVSYAVGVGCAVTVDGLVVRNRRLTRRVKGT